MNEKIDRKLAVDDLKYMLTKIEKKHVSDNKELIERVKKQYEYEVNELPQNPITLDVWIASSRIISKLQDAHTTIGLKGDYFKKKLNVKFKKTEKDLYCEDVNKVKKEVLKINEIDVNELYNRFLNQFSYENEYYLRHCFSNYLKYPEFLGWLGVSCDEEVKIEYTDKTIVEEKFIISEVLNKSDVKDVDFEIDEDKNLVILTLNTCKMNDEYKNTLKEFFTKIKEKDIKNVAIDLRNNGGGNSDVMNEFLRYLNVESYNDFGTKVKYGDKVYTFSNKLKKNYQYKDLIFDGNVYVLTSNKTFSSATMFSVIIQDNNLGKVIGEPCGNKPSSYGDILQYQLPNTKLFFTTTYKYFMRPDISKDNENAQIPDYKVKSSEAMDKLYEIINK
ncbi:S41 family peptidase [Clostridium uliginosum]|uniref:Peptidase family S41 n=1 Tax=Clostridium uliginosum TaxID=119641 RepID=A0A1I1JRJ7_9CLOT|nr:S41 family peptidase [Clostridium uliginosum]SFC51267.1 Peptidase family S41 [Clostridium uliginosum]